MPTKLEELEAELVTLHDRCGTASGHPEFPALNEKRRGVLTQIERQRILTRWEYICLYGYRKWLDFVSENNLAEAHPLAQVSMVELRYADLEPEIGRWDDPGDYPNAVASGPLPSYNYVESVIGEVCIAIYPGGETCEEENDSVVREGSFSPSEIEEMNQEVHEALCESTPAGCSVQKWNITIKQAANPKIVICEVEEFEWPDWEPYEPDYD